MLSFDDMQQVRDAVNTEPNSRLQDKSKLCTELAAARNLCCIYRNLLSILSAAYQSTTFDMAIEAAVKTKETNMQLIKHIDELELRANVRDYIDELSTIQELIATMIASTNNG